MALFSTKNRLLLAKWIKYLLLILLCLYIFYDIVIPLINNNSDQLKDNLYSAYKNIVVYIIIFIVPILVYKKLRSYDDDWRKLAEVLAPVYIIGFLILIFVTITMIGSINLITPEEGIASSQIATPTVNYYKTVDVLGLQTKYGIYGTCSDAARIALEISHTDSIYKCADRKQLGNQNCYFNGYYIDRQVIYDLGSLSDEMCKKEEVKTKTVITTVPTTQPGVFRQNSGSSRSSPTIDIPSLEGRVHELINQQRRTNGLSSLSYDVSLASVARKHSEDMAKNNYFSHDNLRGLGPTERGTQAGYSCYKNYGSYYTNGIAENIFQNNLYDSITYYNGIPSYDWNTQDEIARSTVDGWIQSPGHRQNILTSTYDREGIGVAIASDDKVYITEDFC